MLQAKRRWCANTAPEELVDELENDLGVARLTARLLANRGIRDADHASRFMRKQLKDLERPERMRDLGRAAARFATAIEDRETILVHGDYDVDGSTATALMKQFCRCCSHDAIAWIPHRRIDGYGLSEASLLAVQEHGATLMVTVDCGIADHGWAARIESQTGCDVIITDHHLPQGGLPDCTAVCNPNRPDCDYPDKGLAGVGVAWKLCWATARLLSGGEKVTDRLRAFLLDSLSLVAIGTVADCAPLDGENRILVHHGLKALQATGNHGLRALLGTCRLDQGLVQASDIGWRIGPLLNASGRLGSALRNVQLLCAETAEEAQSLLDAIVIENDERRRLTQELCDAVFDEIESNPSWSERHTLVFAGDGWHQGVVGIVASRLVDRYQKPAAVIGIDAELGKGSLRTIPDVDLGVAIDACRSVLVGGGGHAMAAGLTILPERVPDFIAAFEEHVRQRFPGGLPTPGTRYDCQARIGELDGDFFREYEALAPFGTANPSPVLCVRGVRFAARPGVFGRGSNHLRGALTDRGGGLQQLIAWNTKPLMGELCKPGCAFDMLLRPEINAWRGRCEPRLQYVDGVSC
ncbi:MAG: single-stranded-DNA-specific exonuclease RecJ [Planctomycetota bacterium]